MISWMAGHDKHTTSHMATTIVWTADCQAVRPAGSLPATQNKDYFKSQLWKIHLKENKKAGFYFMQNTQPFQTCTYPSSTHCILIKE